MFIKKLKELLLPDFYFESLSEVDLRIIRKNGRKAVLIDLDNTLVVRNTQEVREEVRNWLKRAQEEEVALCIVSNNWEGRVKKVADELGLPLVAPAGKPRKKAFLIALSLMGAKASEGAIIGDQIFTDILGGNRLGLLTVLVKPISSRELVHTRFLRLLERKILSCHKTKNNCYFVDNIEGVIYDSQLKD